jgi:glutathione synthase/RimK-type ligase-like ATP-grasp enzyme
MRLAILAAGAGWHARDLCRAAELAGHSATVVDFRRISAGVGIFHPLLTDCDAVIVRTMPPGSLEQVVFRMDVLHRLQAAGKRVLNPPLALEICIDKYLATARLEAAGLRVPPTVVCQDAETAQGAFAALGGDVVVKPLFGSEGRGMTRVSDPELAWRTNVAQGGRGEVVRVTPEEERLALAAARACGVTVAGIDLLPGPEGEWYSLEVNAVPGWRALAPVTGIDIAAEIVRFLTSQASGRLGGGEA